MLQPARAPATGPAHPPPPATYGELIDTTQRHVQNAAALSFNTSDPPAAHPELLGYQRFLHTAGELLALLTQLTSARPTGLPLLAARLAALPRPEPTPSAWAKAATTLGAAHDLLATHRGPDRDLRTPDAHDITTGTGAGLATRQVALLLVDAATATDQLVHAARNRQARAPDKPIPLTVFQTIADANRRILLHAKAALWDLDHEPDSPPPSSLAHLSPATRPPVGAASGSFESSLSALRALRELTFHQARGRLPASPASVRDLARLAAAITDPDLGWLPAPTTGLERLRRAHATDQLAPAHRAWNLACRDLPLTIQGTTKAPRAYEAAVGRLLDDATSLSPAVHLAVATALPRLGRDAGRTIRRLHAINALVSPQRDGAALRVHWRPITHAQAADMVGRFETAAAATVPAAVTLRQLISSPDPSHRTAPTACPVPAARPEPLPALGVRR